MKIAAHSIVVTLSGLILLSINAFAVPPPVEYKITINTADLSGFSVEMRVPAVADGTTRIAMAVHPEYDDRPWRNIENFAVTDASGRTLRFSKHEDTVWNIRHPSGDMTIRYRVRIPASERAQRDVWKPFLTPTGGMVGDLRSLMYVAEEQSRRGRVTLVMPAEWRAASGLEPTSDPRVFTGSTELILDSPIMIGNLTEHDFQAGGVPHKIVFWSAPGARPYNADVIVTNIRKLVEEAIRAFGGPPYPRYVFMLHNGGTSALEHQTSVNLSVPSELEDLFVEVAHEYIHVWNLMDVRPRERVGLKYRFAGPTGVLWWNEGATIMFADLLIRRAGLPGESRTRLQRLESLIARYLSSPGYYTLSAELVSFSDSHPPLTGNDFANTHLQGEVLSTMLDLKIRDATDGRRNVIDVMRLLSQRFDNSRGITNSDIELAIAEACGCEIRSFFRQYIYGANKIDFDRYLGLMGIRAEIGTTVATNRDGSPAPDLRIGPASTEGGLKLRISNSQSAWARAGLNTGDTLVSINGVEITTWPALRQWLQSAKIGEVARVVIVRDGVRREVEVTLTGYSIPTVRLVEISSATPKQLRLRNEWSVGN